MHGSASGMSFSNGIIGLAGSVVRQLRMYIMNAMQGRSEQNLLSGLLLYAGHVTLKYMDIKS